MIHDLIHRKAHINDLPAIINLLTEDDLGVLREENKQPINQKYIDAFYKVDVDLNQYLMVIEKDNHIIGTCHLTIMPSLTFLGSIRMQIEAVRVSKQYRSQGIGEWMINAAIDYGKSKDVSIIQLMTHKSRTRAKQFYEKLGFEASHEGMKLLLKDI
ncbi:MAG: GNAT family N-acetyltransferase [Janthinobacterium lividum]